MITGIYTPTSGSIRFQGEELLSRRLPISPIRRPRRPFQITRLGIGRTFQNIRLFADLTAIENVMVGADAHNRAGVLRALARTPAQREEERVTIRRAIQLLGFVGIARYANELGKNLPYGDQRRLEIGRAMATNPKLLLLDEPAAGMIPLIEQNANKALALADRGYVIESGAIVLADSARNLLGNDRVRQAYLGES